MHVVEVSIPLTHSISLNTNFQTIAERLPESSPELLVASVAALDQFVQFAPDSFEHRSDVIMEYLLKQVVSATIPPSEVCKAYRFMCKLQSRF